MNIFVGNLSFQVTEEELRQEFAAFGEVTHVTLMNDKYIGSGQSTGYGFVEMPSKSEGYTAIAGLNRKTLRGRVVDVIAALPLSHDTDTRATGGRRGGGYSGRGRKHRY